MEKFIYVWYRQASVYEYELGEIPCIYNIYVYFITVVYSIYDFMIRYSLRLTHNFTKFSQELRTL